MEARFASPQPYSSFDDFGKAFPEQGNIGFEISTDNFQSQTSEISMDVESDTRSFPIFAQGFLNSPLMEKETKRDKENYSKQCLKFCRRISNVFLKYILRDEGIAHEVFKLNAGVLKNFATALSLPAPSTYELIKIQIETLQRLWGKFRDHLAFSKNKKISIVQQEYWDLIFSKEASIKHLREDIKTLSGLWRTNEGRQLLQEDTVNELLARMMYCSSKMLVMYLILEDPFEKKSFSEGLEKMENFILLGLYPGFFKYYNHKSGKFALECCGKCKVCCSKLLPPNFLIELNSARRGLSFVISKLSEMSAWYGSKPFELVVCLMEFAYNQFA